MPDQKAEKRRFILVIFLTFLTFSSCTLNFVMSHNENGSTDHVETKQDPDIDSNLEIPLNKGGI